MSTSRGSGAGNGDVVQSVPAGSREVVHSLKEIVNCSEAEIYATLKECNMDPNEAVSRLLSQDHFHEVKSKREKKKEGKDNSESRTRGSNHSSNRGSKTSADRHLGRGASASYYSSDHPSHGKLTYKKENGSGPYSGSLSSVLGVSGNNRSRGSSGLSGDASAGSKGSLLGTTDVTPSAMHPAQPSWVGNPGQVSMADIVRMGKPNKKGSHAPNASYHYVQDPSLGEALHTDHAFKVHQLEVPTNDEWPSIENPPSHVISIPEHPVDPELHLEASVLSYDNISDDLGDDEVEEEEGDNFESSDGNAVGSVSVCNRMVPEDDSRGPSLFENDMYKNVGSYQAESQNFEPHEVREVGASVTSVTRNLQQLIVDKDGREFPSEGYVPSVVIPDHLQVQTADCSHLSFGSFGSGMSVPYSSGAKTSVLEQTNLEEGCNESDESSAGHSETKHSEYYVDDTLRNAPDGSLLHRNGAGVGSYETSSAPQPEELIPESADVAHGNQYPFPSSNAGYTFDDAQRLNAAFSQTSSQMQSLAPFPNVMPSYTNSLPSSLLAANVHPTRESDLQYSPFPVTQPISAKYVNSVSSIGVSAISMSEALMTAGLSSSQPVPQSLSGTSVATGPPLPQHLAVHPYSQPTLPLGPFTNMISYPFLPQSYTYMPSAFQQSFAGSSNYHQSVAAVLPQYKSSVSVSNLPPQSASVASGYGGFGSGTTIPGNYSITPSNAAPSGTSLSYDDVLSSQYKDTSHLLSLQQNENSVTWLHGPNSRTMPAVPASSYYNYQTQNQQPGGFRQVQQQSQNYGNPSYPNFYHSQSGISVDQQQNPRDGSLGGSQGQPKQSQIWPNNY